MVGRAKRRGVRRERSLMLKGVRMDVGCVRWRV